MATLLALLLPLAATAQPAGEIEFARGIGSAQTPGATPRALSQGVPVGQGDVLTMGSNSFAVVKLTDGTRITLRPNTMVKIDDYAFDQPGKNDSLVANLLKGGLRVVTGLISKRSTEAARLTTVTATVGIRGTDFDARICAADCAADGARIAQKSEPSLIAASARVAQAQGPLNVVASDGERRAVAPGGPIYPGDTIETAENGYAVLVFRDDTKVTVQPKTRFKVDGFIFTPGKPADGNVAFNLIAGGMRVLTGLIGKARPQAVRMVTSTATVGIRGSLIEVFIDPTGCAAGGAAGCTIVTATEGEGILNPGTPFEVVVRIGEFHVQESPGQPPRLLLTPPLFFRDLRTPSPNTVPTRADDLFAAGQVNEAEAGLFVFARDGHLQLTVGDKVMDIARGETGYIDPSGTRLTRAIVTPNFLQFDFIPRPDRFDPATGRMLGLAGSFRVKSALACTR
jgi:hypothetical protein